MWPPPGTRTAWGRMPGQLNFRISLFVASGVVSGHGLGLRLQGGGEHSRHVACRSGKRLVCVSDEAIYQEIIRATMATVT